jgi:hypothetical protein
MRVKGLDNYGGGERVDVVLSTGIFTGLFLLVE